VSGTARRRPDGRHPGLIAGAALAVLAVDQLTKWWATTALSGGRVIDVIWTLRLRLVHNTGAAFGLFGGLGPLLGVVAAAVAVALLRSRRLTSGRMGSAAVGCIAGGAVGNLCDRAFRTEGGLLDGAVVDFVDVQFWPVWNAADMAITVSAALLAFNVARGPRSAPAVSP